MKATLVFPSMLLEHISAHGTNGTQKWSKTHRTIASKWCPLSVNLGNSLPRASFEQVKAARLPARTSWFSGSNVDALKKLVVAIMRMMAPRPLNRVGSISETSGRLSQDSRCLP